MSVKDREGWRECSGGGGGWIIREHSWQQHKRRHAKK
jgi:hypothetical protein